MHKISVIAFILVLFASCNSDTLFSENKTLPGYWDKDDEVSFTLPQLDSLKKYNLYLTIRNSNEYRYSNLFLIVSMKFPFGKTVNDTLEYRMANPDGSWLGQGIGSVKENKLWYKENVSFTEKGTYTMKIRHAMRNNGDVEGVSLLEGITDVGYSIEQASQQE